MIELSSVTKSFGAHRVLKGITGSVQRLILSRPAVEAVTRTMRAEWGGELIRAWNTCGWIGKPRVLGDRIDDG